MKKRMLIVDDHADFRTAVKDYLNRQKMDMEIYEASSGEMGVTKASCVKPDIVLMDIHLPKVNGLDAAKIIREDNPNCDIIILTMFNVEIFKKAAENIQAREFISKTDIYDNLLPAIRKCFEAKKNES